MSIAVGILSEWRGKLQAEAVGQYFFHLAFYQTGPRASFRVENMARI
jgi:hypothetical protein